MARLVWWQGTYVHYLSASGGSTAFVSRPIVPRHDEDYMYMRGSASSFCTRHDDDYLFMNGGKSASAFGQHVPICQLPYLVDDQRVDV